MRNIIIGQEAICPDGLGRVSKVTEEICDKLSITVETYSNNRSCSWAEHNVELIDPRGVKELPYIEEKCGSVSSKRSFEKAYVISGGGFPQIVVLGDEEKAEEIMQEMIEATGKSSPDNTISWCIEKVNIIT